MRKFRCIIIILLIVALSTSFASAYSKSASKTALFYGIHTDYGASVWGVEMYTAVDYTYSNSKYTATKLTTSATMYPQHTYGSGSVTVASMHQTADSGTSVTYGIKPTASSFWTYQSLIVPTGTKIYFSYYGNMNKVFYYSLVETLYITFSVPNTYFANSNASLSLTVGSSS